MWVLNENKIDLAKNKYNLKNEGMEHSYYSIRNSKGKTIIGFDKENKITSYGVITTPKIYQDLIYDLIKDDVLMLKRESETEKLNKRIEKKEETIQKLKEEIEKLKSQMKGE